MIDHLRDTVFGQTVRLLSRKTLLKFPDEQNTDLWRSFIQTSVHNDGKLKDGGEAVGQDTEHALKAVNDAQASSSEEQHSSHRGLENNNEKDEEVILVDWYGSNDQEVLRPIPYVMTRFRWLTDCRTPKIGRRAVNCWLPSRYVSSTLGSTLVAPYTHLVRKTS